MRLLVCKVHTLFCIALSMEIISMERQRVEGNHLKDVWISVKSISIIVLTAQEIMGV